MSTQNFDASKIESPIQARRNSPEIFYGFMDTALTYSNIKESDLSHILSPSDTSIVEFNITSKIKLYKRLHPNSILFTAPHTLYLNRDGFEDHKPEDYTSSLAQKLAEITGGICVNWNDEERARIKELGKADPINRDPNYLHDDELQDSPWLLAMNMCIMDFGIRRMHSLHVDIHGMKDHGVDCLIGTKAMVKHFQWTQEVHEIFQTKVTDILGQLLLRKGFRKLCFNHAPDGTNFTGRWNCDGRNTLTQMSTNISLFPESLGCFRCAIQVELSKPLRKALINDKHFRNEFANIFHIVCSFSK